MKIISIKACCTLIVAFLLCTSAWAQKGDAIKGIWWNAEKTAKVQIYEENGKYFGKIIHLEEPLDENGKVKTDKENPNSNLRNRKIEGLIILTELVHKSDNKFDDGEIYDPKSGKTYSANAVLVDNNRLDLRGYIGFSIIGRTSTWTRVE